MRNKTSFWLVGAETAPPKLYFALQKDEYLIEYFINPAPNRTRKRNDKDVHGKTDATHSKKQENAQRQTY